jgi:cytochrome d ubiquinol oxidase subunit I
MDSALLARIQFAFTAGFHFIFPPLTIGLSWFIVWMLGRYKKTADDFWKKSARFWIKIFAVTFAVGVATGITLEFQFGMNWSEYSKFVGDVFGAPLAAEGIFAFFLESIFVAVLIYGWNKVSVKTLWISSILVAVGATLSGFWIIVANSWMQTPAGFHIVNGRAELLDFFAAVFNSSTLPRYFHTIAASIVTGAFFILGVSAYFILKDRETRFARKFFTSALIVSFIFSVIQLGLGHVHSIQVAFTQPAKLAAIEGVFETQKGAPALVFGIPDAKEEKMHAAIRIPKLLSLLAFGKLDAEVKGLKDFPKDEWPPLGLTFYPFHLMVALGLFFIAFGALGLFLLWKKKLFEERNYMKAALFIVPLPFIANELGWITAEAGRQPWIVYRVMKTRDAVSISVPASHIAISLTAVAIVYALLFAAWIYLIRREIKSGPNIDEG